MNLTSILSYIPVYKTISKNNVGNLLTIVYNQYVTIVIIY
jgi:hypothetical protein